LIPASTGYDPFSHAMGQVQPGEFFAEMARIGCLSVAEAEPFNCLAVYGCRWQNKTSA
jgi:hypothetical protein